MYFRNRCSHKDDDLEDNGPYVEPTTKRQRYYKRYYYTMPNFKEREESARRNLMKLEQRAKNFYISNRNDGWKNITCRNCLLSFQIDDVIEHALECYGVDRLMQFRKRIYHCPVCEYATHSRRYMIEHFVLRHCNKTSDCLYHCKPCNLGFPRKALFDSHKLIRHQHKFEYYCFICNKSFHKHVHFRDHMDIHFGRRYRCFLCNKTISTLQNLKFHMMAIHWNGYKNYSCQECGKKFALKKQLREHERIHTGYAPARCKICNQSFALYSNLNAHYNKHLKKRAYNCKNCSLSFNYLSNLIRHRRIKHSNENGKYICNYCGKWFIDKRDFEDHVSVHTSKPYSYTNLCNVCNATFRIKKFLRRHMQTHLTTYDCILCNKSFKQKPSMLRHNQIKHASCYGIQTYLKSLTIFSFNFRRYGVFRMSPKENGRIRYHILISLTTV